MGHVTEVTVRRACFPWHTQELWLAAWTDLQGLRQFEKGCFQTSTGRGSASWQNRALYLVMTCTCPLHLSWASSFVLHGVLTCVGLAASHNKGSAVLWAAPPKILSFFPHPPVDTWPPEMVILAHAFCCLCGPQPYFQLRTEGRCGLGLPDLCV